MADRSGLRTAYGSQQWQRKIRNLGLVFDPSTQMPTLPLAVLQLLLKGGLAPDSGFDKAVQRHFGQENLQFQHLASMMQMFDFKVKPKDAHIALGVIISFILMCRAMFGTQGAFRVWCMLFDMTLSNCKVMYDDTEGVATLKEYVKTEDYDEGYDTSFPHYTIAVFHTLRNFRRRSEIDAVNMLAVSGSTYHRDVAQALGTIVDSGPFEGRYGRAASGGYLPTSGGYMVLPADDGGVRADLSWAARGLTDGLLGDLVRANLGTLTDPVALSQRNPTAYGDTLDQLASSPWAVPPTVWPLRGHTRAELDGLHPIQRHKSRRTADVVIGGVPRRIAYVHDGLDLPADLNTPILSPWAGRVVEAQDGWDAARDAGDPDKSRGNWIRVHYGGAPGEHDALPGGARLVMDVLHASELAVEAGEEVAPGDTLALVGNTGNSTGPHLHLTTRWVLPNPTTGSSQREWQLDPEIVLRDGPLAAARAAGVPLLPSAPVLGGAVWALDTIVRGGAAPASYGGFADTFRALLNRADEGTRQALNTVRDVVGQETFDDLAESVVEATDGALNWAVGPGRDVIKTIGDKLGLGDQLNDVLDVLNRSWDAGLSDNFDSSQVQFDAGLEAAREVLSRHNVDPVKIGSWSSSVRNAGIGLLGGPYV